MLTCSVASVATIRADDGDGGGGEGVKKEEIEEDGEEEDVASVTHMPECCTAAAVSLGTERWITRAVCRAR